MNPKPPATHMPCTDNFLLFLDRSLEELSESDNVVEAMNRLSDGLWWFRHFNANSWPQQIDQALAHPIKGLVHQDPFSRRSFEKPRGYPGDAGLLDLIYFDQGFANFSGVSQQGRRIYWRNRNAPAPRAVRERRDHMAALLDRTALRKPGGHALAVAAGHMREGLCSSSLHTAGLSRIVAFDQDQQSLSEVARCYGQKVECVTGSIRSLVGKGWSDQQFDLIYAAGLFDYLGDQVASRLIERLFAMLGPGGELVVANFTPEILDAGYMETYMGWKLIYRTTDQMLELCQDMPNSVQSMASAYHLDAPDICYLRLSKDS